VYLSFASWKSAVMKWRMLYHMSERNSRVSKKANAKTYVLMIAVMNVPHGKLQFALRGTT
jgi:hypothetical protein